MEHSIFTVDERSVVFERYDNEVITINLNTGIYYTLNTTAADVFEFLASGCPVAELIAALQPRYSNDLRLFETDLLRFVSELSKAGLIEPSKDNGRRPFEPISESQPKSIFESPVLRTHDDLQELFLLDPVHEVGAEGWPMPEGLQP